MARSYTVQIRNNYDPWIFEDGSKVRSLRLVEYALVAGSFRSVVADRRVQEFYLATVDATLGGKNSLLSWAYIGVGVLCLLVPSFFLPTATATTTTKRVWRLASLSGPHVAMRVVLRTTNAWQMRQVGMIFGLKSCFYDGNETALKSLAELSA